MKKIIHSIVIIIIITISLANYISNKSLSNILSNKEILIDASENITPTSINMSYDSFTGYRIKNIELDECEACEVEVNIKSEAGSISLSITDEDGYLCYEEKNLPTGKFTLSLSGGNFYTIKVSSTNHEGSFDISFNVIE